MTPNEFSDVEKAVRHALRVGAPGLSEIVKGAIVSSIMRRILPLTAVHTHKRFTCKGCGTDWMTVLPDVETCQVCYHRGQPDIADWIKG